MSDGAAIRHGRTKPDEEARKYRPQWPRPKELEVGLSHNLRVDLFRIDLARIRQNAGLIGTEIEREHLREDQRQNLATDQKPEEKRQSVPLELL